jgi:hypothetical protein
MPVLAWIVIAVLLVAVVGGVWAVRLERRSPSSYTRGGGLAWWGLLPAEEQEAVDDAALELAEQAEIDARQDAAEAAVFLAHRAQANDLFHR